MDQKHNREVDALLADAARAIGADKPDTATPQIRALMEKLSPKDMEKLRSILSDKAQVQALVNSPQGQQILRQIAQQRGQKGKDGK